MNGWTLLAKEDIPNYDLYSDGKFVDFGVLNGVYDESYE
jgi:hypothetical protein